MERLSKDVFVLRMSSLKGEVLISICFYFCLFNQISKMLLHAYCKTIFHVYCKVCIVCQTSLSDLK